MGSDFAARNKLSYRKNAIKNVIKCSDMNWLKLILKDDKENKFVTAMHTLCIHFNFIQQLENITK